MASQNKLIQYISKFRKKTWKQEIAQEKKQKYLFGSESSSQQFDRAKKTNLLYDPKKLGAFFNFFQDSLNIGNNSQNNYQGLMSLIGVFLIFLCSYIVIFSPYFRISPSNILIEAVTPGININIASRVLENTYGESIFFLDEELISKNLKSEIKNIESIEISRLYPSGLKVMITGGKIPFLTTIYGIQKKNWGLSSNGVLVSAIDLQKGSTKYLLELIDPNLIGEIFLQYKQVVSEYNMKNINRILEVFDNEWKQLEIDHIRYFVVENELHVSLKSKTILIFALQDDIVAKNPEQPTHIINELMTLQSYISENTKKLTDGTLSYVDARIPGKLFVCGQPMESCKNNLILTYGDSYK